VRSPFVSSHLFVISSELSVLQNPSRQSKPRSFMTSVTSFALLLLLRAPWVNGKNKGCLGSKVSWDRGVAKDGWWYETEPESMRPWDWGAVRAVRSSSGSKSRSRWPNSEKPTTQWLLRWYLVN
jgi:hypothetical protein